MTSVVQMYHWLFTEACDTRVKEWWLMDGPITLAFIVVLYLYLVKIKLPELMKNREPYSLKTVIRCYNIFQIIANTYISLGVLINSWSYNLSLGCYIPDYTDRPEAVREATLVHQFFILKVIELVETIFFILRKKDNQASFLHIYHHVISCSLMWIAVKYVPGGMACVPIMLNSFIHVIMYSYYLLSSIGSDRMKKVLNRYKSWITTIQMIQFVFLLFHGLQTLHPSCLGPKILLVLYVPNVIVVYYLFDDFFRNTYKKKNKK